MASLAQMHANMANARKSTGPKTAEGKARSARNNFQHGFTLGLLTITAEEKPQFTQFEADLRSEIKPRGAFQEEAFQQFRDAYWRLRKITAAVHLLAAEYNEDPFVHPAAEAPLRQLTRYRAAAEMALYRSIHALQELQTAELNRALHLTEEESKSVPPLVNPGPKMVVGHEFHPVEDRRLFERLRKLQAPVSPGRTQSPPGKNQMRRSAA